MQIDPKRSPSAVARHDASQASPRKASPAGDHTKFSQTEALDRAYRAVPETRSEVIARAKELVASPTYPPPETIRKISELLADRLSSNRE